MIRVYAALSLLVAIGLWPMAISAQQPGPDSALPEGTYILDEVRVVGATYTDPQTVMLFSGLAPGVEVTWPSTAFSDALEKLWKQEIFSDVAIEFGGLKGDRLTILIQVTERPRLTNYRFRGIRGGQAEELSERIGFVRGTILTESKKRDARRIIMNFFQEKGYLDVEVDQIVEYDTLLGNNGVSIIIDVAKGPRVKVRNIYVEGNESFKDKTIRKNLKNTKELRPGRFWKKSKYQKGSFLEDKEKLITFLNSKGYRDAEIVSDSISRIPKKKGFFSFGRRDQKWVEGRINVHLKLYEGPKYYYGNIDWVGNQKYTDAELNRVLDIKTGDTYNRERLDRKLSYDPQSLDISSLYLDDGYLFFNADPVEVLGVGDTIHLQIRIYEGPQATINKIILDGNETTSDFVILREIRTLPGEKFSRTLLVRSQQEIANLGYFDQQNMDIVPLPDPSRGTVDIKYVVPEQSNDQITLQGGWGGRLNDSQGNRIGGGLVATVGLQFNNFATSKIFKKGAWSPIPRGQGQKLSLTVQTNGPNFQNYAISFLEPWFGGKKPTSLGFSVNYSRQQSLTTDYRFEIIGGSIDLGQRLKWPDDFFRSYTSLGYRKYLFREAGGLFGGLNSGNINIVSVKQTFDRTSIDRPIYSSSGAQITLSAEATPPWSLILNRDLSNASQEEKFELLEFYKIKFDVRTYLSLTRGKKPIVLAPRLQFGFLGAYDQGLGISPFERFYIGGDGLQGFNIDGREILQLRGYSREYLGPVAGGTSFAKYTLELRIPLTLEQSSMIWIHGFAEAGDAWDTIDNFNPFELSRSAGFGLRAFLPMFGLLGLDWGYGFDPAVDPNGEPMGGGQLHFIIGQQF